MLRGAERPDKRLRKLFLKDRVGKGARAFLGVYEKRGPRRQTRAPWRENGHDTALEEVAGRRKPGDLLRDDGGAPALGSMRDNEGKMLRGDPACPRKAREILPR